METLFPTSGSLDNISSRKIFSNKNSLIMLLNKLGRGGLQSYSQLCSWASATLEGAQILFPLVRRSSLRLGTRGIQQIPLGCRRCQKNRVC